jgi:hypothetical protein
VANPRPTLLSVLMKQKFTTPSFSFIFAILPFVSFCIFLIFFATNLPQGDDFALILNFLSEYVSAKGGFIAKWKLLSDQFVEHRLFYTRFIVLSQYLLSGEVSFYIITILGNLSLVGIFMLSWRQLQLASHSVYYLIPISLLVFQPCYSYDGVLWPAATLAYNSVSFFALLTIHWLSSRHNFHFWLALGAAALCTYTFGNGVLILVAGAGLLVVQKRWKELLIWSIFTISILLVYFSDYQQYENRNNPIHNLLNHPQYIFLNFLVFLGSALNWDEEWLRPLNLNDSASVLAGGLVLATFFYLFFQTIKAWIQPNTAPQKVNKSERRFTEFLFGSFIFFILTGFLLCISRVDKDQVFAHINRYRIHSVVGLVLTYCMVLRYLQSKSLLYALTFGSILGIFMLSYFHFYSIFAQYKREYITAQYNWVTSNQWFIYRDTSYWEESSKLVMNKAAKSINFRITDSPFSQVIVKDETVSDFKIEQNKSKKMLKMMGSAPKLRPFGASEDYFVAFKNLTTSTTYLVSTTYDRRSIRLVLMGENYYYPQFYRELTYRHFPTGTYQIGVAYSRNNTLELKWQPFTFEAVQESNLVY